MAEEGEQERGYDWIDDAFDEGKEDPLAAKGMTGCSGLGIALAAIAVLVVAAILGLILLSLPVLVSAGGSV